MSQWLISAFCCRWLGWSRLWGMKQNVPQNKGNIGMGVLLIARPNPFRYFVSCGITHVYHQFINIQNHKFSCIFQMFTTCLPWFLKMCFEHVFIVLNHMFVIYFKQYNIWIVSYIHSSWMSPHLSIPIGRLCSRVTHLLIMFSLSFNFFTISCVSPMLRWSSPYLKDNLCTYIVIMVEIRLIVLFHAA